MEANSEVFAAVIGMVAQGCWLGYGSTLFIEFRPPQPEREFVRHPRGEFALQTPSLMLWRIEQGDQIIAGSQDDSPALDEAPKALNGKILLAAYLFDDTFDSVLIFSEGIVFRTFSASGWTGSIENDYLWLLRTDAGSYFNLWPSGMRLREERHALTGVSG